MNAHSDDRDEYLERLHAVCDARRRPFFERKGRRRRKARIRRGLKRGVRAIWHGPVASGRQQLANVLMKVVEWLRPGRWSA